MGWGEVRSDWELLTLLGGGDAQMLSPPYLVSQLSLQHTSATPNFTAHLSSLPGKQKRSSREGFFFTSSGNEL